MGLDEATGQRIRPSSHDGKVDAPLRPRTELTPVRTGPEGRTRDHGAHRTPGPARAGASRAGRGLAGGHPRLGGGGGGKAQRSAVVGPVSNELDKCPKT